MHTRNKNIIITGILKNIVVEYYGRALILLQYYMSLLHEDMEARR